AIADTLAIIVQPHGQDDPKPALSLAQGDIEFRNVRFAYPGGRIVFEDFNLHIPAGQKVGVVGRSGAGKSTLLALIQRLDDVQGGAVLIDGQDISEVSQDSVRDRLAVVPQEAALFNRSIRENIRYGRPSATDAEVVEAARNAFCDAFIRELPQGYDALVGERGVLRGGGQRQLLGIARAFLKDAPILILDEATSSLDTRSEGEIQTALAKLMMGRAVVSVAHRLSTLSSFDRIVVLKNGQIVEDGSPSELRSLGGLFASVWNMQVGGFINEDVRNGN